MSNLTRYDPFSMEPVSDLFHGLFRPLRGIATGDDAPLADLKLDVTENDTAYTVKAELPGVDKKDINHISQLRDSCLPTVRSSLQMQAGLSDIDLGEYRLAADQTGIQSVRLVPSAQTTTITRKIRRELHWVRTLDHASGGFEAASVWPAICRSTPGASFCCVSTNHHFSVKAIDASPLPIRTAPSNGSRTGPDGRKAKLIMRYATAAPLTAADITMNHNGKRRLIAAMNALIVSS